MKKWCSIIVSVIVMLLLLVMPVSALDASITEITTDGWVNYKKLNMVQFTYKVNTSEGSDAGSIYKVKAVENLSLPYGPKYFLLDDEIISEFWLKVTLNNYVDEDAVETEIAVLRPGEAIALNAGLKLWFAGSNSQDSFAPIMADMYECRLYLDDENSKYISPTLETSTQNGAYLYWSFTNNTDKDIVLSRIAMGVFDDGGKNIYDSYGYGYALRALKYRIFTDQQLATQAIQDSIDKQTEEITGSIQDQTDQITDAMDQQTEKQKGFFAQLGDRISGFFSNLTSSLGGFFSELGDKLTDGWSGESSTPDGSGAVTDLDNLESGLLSDSQDGLNSLNGYLGETTRFFKTLTSCFGAVGSIFSLVIGMDCMNSIVTVSLAIGLFSFLLGVGPSLVSSFSSHQRRAEKTKGGSK